MLAGAVIHSANIERVRPAFNGSAMNAAADLYPIFEPALVLPQQLGDGRLATRGGEFGLLWAVFTDGIETYCREILRGNTQNLAYREVDRWIFRPTSDAVTSFANLCEIFGMDPRRMRRALIRFREHPSEGILNLMAMDGRLGAEPRETQ